MGSSNWTGSQENGLWEQTKVVGVGAAGQAKVIGVAAAQKVVAFGVGAVKLLPSNKKWYYGNMKNENEIKAEAQRRKEEEMERNKIRQEMEEAKKRKQAVCDELEDVMEGGGNIVDYHNTMAIGRFSFSSDERMKRD
ncbi:hypothetical protein Bca52824_036334 [Brassica carinata]|uniref:Uncharacterized protein n=1 Tax=Brassica carinata TaxID=52824 RepID=A0A8X7S517_BRACI|nr:hypothetical protein Bca52824_036334 [Brassica carinata]